MPEDEYMEARIRAAVEKEQRAIAGDQFYREALMAVAQKVNAGIYNKYVFEVGSEEYEQFKKDNPVSARESTKKEKSDE